MKRGFLISILALMLQAPAYGESSSGFVLQDILDKFRDSYQALLRGNGNTDHALPDAVQYGAVASDSRYAKDGILKSKDHITYEYMTNGVLMDIKVVPKNNIRNLAASLAGKDSANQERGGIFPRPYYMTPADGSPHYSDLERAERLYPQWVIKEF